MNCLRVWRHVLVGVMAIAPVAPLRAGQQGTPKVVTLADCGDAGTAAAGTPAALLNQRKHAVARPEPATTVLSVLDFARLQDATWRLLPDGRGKPVTADGRAKLTNLETSAGRVSEGAHVAIVGYIVIDDTPEATTDDPANCNLRGEVNNTIRMKIGELADAVPSEAVTVSLEPKGRPARWSVAALERVRDAGLKLRASGQLLYNNMPAAADAENAAILWEIHPAGALEVCMRAAGDCPSAGPDGWSGLATISAAEITALQEKPSEPPRDTGPIRILPSQAAPLPAADAPGGTVKPAVAATRKNTYVFDHAYLEGRPGTDPAVLYVRDGEYFQIVVANTDPRKFTYRINALEAEDTLKASDFSIGAHHISTDVADLRTASVTMQHRKMIGKYRVHIAVRPDLVEQAPATPGVARAPKAPISIQGVPSFRGDIVRPPVTTAVREGQIELYSVDFDVWVRTRDNWTTAFTSGVAFSGLTDRQFYIETNDNGTPANAADDTKMFREDKGARDIFKPELVALVNLWNPSWHNLGVLFGMGLNNSADPRYMVGGSYYLGRQFVLTGGLIGGKVRVTPSGQALDTPPINDNIAATVTTRFEHSLFFGLGFEFSDRKQFIQDYFASGTGASGPAIATAAALADDVIAGTYTGQRGDDTVTWEVAIKDQALTITEGSTAFFKSTERAGDTFKAGGQIAQFRQEGDTITLAYRKDNEQEIVLKKTAK